MSVKLPRIAMKVYPITVLTLCVVAPWLVIKTLREHKAREGR